MGLAASQARFLGLTARKSNIEYQGQQVNQARTELANEVMNLYQKYNNLKVPVPPSINDYTKTVYSLDDSPKDYKLKDYSKIPSGEYKDYYNVTLSYDEDVPKVYPYTASGAIISVVDSGDTFSEINFTLGLDSYYYKKGDENSTITKIAGDYDKYYGLRTIMESHGWTDGVYYMITKDNKVCYTPENDLKETKYEIIEGKKTYHGNYTYEYQGAREETKEVNGIAAISQASTGRLSTINIIKCDDTDLEGHAFSITTTSEDDQRAYDDAMNQYYYEKQSYERQVEVINKETEKIQTQDKALELKLNQLDTEQNAISTEMDSVSKVIEDTIESVFKTFNS